MSNLFSDPEYTRMATDESAWLELAIEPFRFPLNDILNKLPEKLEFTFDDICNAVKKDSSYMRLGSNKFELDISRLPINKVKSLFKEEFSNLSYREREIIERAYKLELFKEPVRINFKTKAMSATLTFTKQFNCIKEDDILEHCANICTAYMHFSSGWDRSEAPDIRSRLNEVIDILGLQGRVRTTRSIDNKLRYLKVEMKKIIRNNTWNIKSIDLFKGLCQNIIDYTQHGNMHALMNITRLKCMTHKGAPIYSMEEIK